MTTPTPKQSTCACGSHNVIGKVFPDIAAPTFVQPDAPKVPKPSDEADTIIVGTITTMNPKQPTAEAVAIENGRITAVGSSDDVMKLKGPKTEIIHTEKGAAYPGFFDAHMHYWVSAYLYDFLDVSTKNGRTHDEVLGILKQAKPTRGDWVLGTLYDPSLVAGNKELTLEELDLVQPDRPCAVLNASMHWLYCNSKALELAGITADTKAPVGGIIAKVDGKLTGALGEQSAMNLVMSKMPPLTQTDVENNLVAINRHAASRGVTHCHDAGTGAMQGVSEIHLIHSLADRLHGRITYGIMDSAMDQALAIGTKPMQGDDMVRATAWKIVSDGSNQGYSGYQLHDYLNKDFRGHPNFSTDYLIERITKAIDGGWQMMIHSNGDASIAQAIEAYTKAFKGKDYSKLRNRIEHCSFPTPEDLKQMKDLNLSPSFLIGHVYYWGHAFLHDIMGAAKTQRLDPVGSAGKLGLHPTMHSDYTVTDIEPLRYVQTAVERKMRVGGEVLAPLERVDLNTAFEAVTINSAWQTHCDDTQGSIEVGKLADVTILKDDPAKVDTSEIATIGVAATLVNGKTVFRL